MGTLEALEFLEQSYEESVKNGDSDGVAAKKIAISAIKKQMAVVPDHYEKNLEKHDASGYCPICKTFVIRNEFYPEYHNYCDHCGQKFDWDV